MPAPVPNSSIAGYLPALNTEAEDDVLVDLFHDYVANISGLTQNVLFPRWQAEPPNLPVFGTNWGAIGITERRTEPFAAVIHFPDNAGDQGHDTVIRSEDIDVMVTFYGPQCSTYATNLREGVQVWQNNQVLRQNNMAFVQTGPMTRAPELIRERWLDRVDILLTFRRQVFRKYAVLDLLEATGTIQGDSDNAESHFQSGPISEP